MANLTGNLKDSMTATFPREFDIPNPMTIQEIYDKINARAAAFQMPFSIKGGVPGERIVFAKEPNLDVTIWLHVKDGTHIKITPVTTSSSATINEMLSTAACTSIQPYSGSSASMTNSSGMSSTPLRKTEQVLLSL